MPVKYVFEVEKCIEESLLDERGLIRSGINIDTMKPFPKGYFQDSDVYNYPGHNWNDFSDFIAYENAGMCSGAYLAAQAWKYRATKTSEALEKAYRTFKGIKWLFDISQEIEEGFFCKCYGGKISEQISSDQYIYTFAGLDEFMDFADEETKIQCVEMIEKMTRYWIRKNYSYPYFGKPLEWPIERFAVFSWLAYYHTGKKEFLDEFERLCSIPDVLEKIPFGCSLENLLDQISERDVVFDFEKNSNLRSFTPCTENAESGLLSIAPLLKYSAPHRKIWMDKLMEMYERDLRFITDDGFAMCRCFYDIVNNNIYEVKEQMNVPLSGEWKFFGFIGWIRSAMQSLMFARAAIGMHTYLKDDEMLELAAKILRKINLKNMYWFHDMDGKQFPEDLKWMDKVFSGDAAAHWLWAYWEGAAKYGKDWTSEYSG